jgi:hypothetical protein
MEVPVDKMNDATINVHEDARKKVFVFARDLVEAADVSLKFE